MPTILKLHECRRKKKKRWAAALKNSMQTGLISALQNAKRESTLFVDKYLLLACQSVLSKIKNKLHRRDVAMAVILPDTQLPCQRKN